MKKKQKVILAVVISGLLGVSVVALGQKKKKKRSLYSTPVLTKVVPAPISDNPRAFDEVKEKDRSPSSGQYEPHLPDKKKEIISP